MGGSGFLGGGTEGLGGLLRQEQKGSKHLCSPLDSAPGVSSATEAGGAVQARAAGPSLPGPPRAQGPRSEAVLPPASHFFEA